MELILSLMLPVKEDDCHVWKTRLSKVYKIYRNIKLVIYHGENNKYCLSNMRKDGLQYFKVDITEVFGKLVATPIAKSNFLFF